MVAITNQDQAKRVFDGLTSGGRWQSNELSSYVSKKLFKELLERDDCLEYLPDPSVWAGKVDLSSGHLKAVKNGDHLAVFNISYAARDMIRHINDFLRELDITLSDESLPEDRKRNAEKLLSFSQLKLSVCKMRWLINIISNRHIIRYEFWVYVKNVRK